MHAWLNLGAKVIAKGTGLYLSVMISFMYQLDWVMEFPGIWSNIILGMSMRVF